jgi:hypothetical protein
MPVGSPSPTKFGDRAWAHDQPCRDFERGKEIALLAPAAENALAA